MYGLHLVSAKTRLLQGRGALEPLGAITSRCWVFLQFRVVRVAIFVETAAVITQQVG